MQVSIAFVGFEVGGEFVVFRDVVDFILDSTDCPPADVPEFQRGEPERIEVVRHLLLVTDGRRVDAGDDPFCHS